MAMIEKATRTSSKDIPVSRPQRTTLVMEPRGLGYPPGKPIHPQLYPSSDFAQYLHAAPRGTAVGQETNSGDAAVHFAFRDQGTEVNGVRQGAQRLPSNSIPVLRQIENEACFAPT